MTEIEYRPIQKIAVHEIIKHSFDDFIKLKARPHNPNALPIQARWADGIVFTAGAYPPTPELINEQVQGTIHWADVEFTEMEEFQPVITNQNSGGSITVVDCSNNTAVSDFVRWLKKQPQWFAPAIAA